MYFLNAVKITKLLYKGTFKVSTLVRMEACWHSKLIEPFGHQNICHGGSPLVPGGHRLGELGENVCHHKDIFFAILGRLEECKVNSQDLIRFGSKKVTHGCLGLWVGYLGKRAALTPLAPILDVFIHMGPIASLPNEFCCPLHPLMTMPLVQLLQNLFPQRLWQEYLVSVFTTIFSVNVAI